MKTLRFIFLGAALCLYINNLFGQTDSTSIIKPFGIGLHLEQFKINDISDLTDFPGNKIALSISTGNSFRFEPEFGFRSGKGESGDLNTKSSTVTLGLGSFIMFQHKKLNTYIGFRMELGIMKFTEDYMGSKVTEKSDRFLIGPAIGAEYFLGEKFSFGGEIGLRNVSSKTTKEPKPTGYQNEKISFFATDTGLFVRFYF